METVERKILHHNSEKEFVDLLEGRLPTLTHLNAKTPALVEESLCQLESVLAEGGAIIVNSGSIKGRSPEDRYITPYPDIWWGKNNQQIESEYYEILRKKFLDGIEEKTLFIQDRVVGAGSPSHKMPIRVISTKSWHSLFARNMFRPREENEETHIPGLTVIVDPWLKASPGEGTRSQNFVIINFERREILIGGTEYSGEIKKAVFSYMNYILPQKDVLPMHCAVNCGDDPDDVAIFFGLSGTGKTTLSTDGTRKLIGDDEHGWSADGVFNFEGGCYAKVIRISEEEEPDIYKTTSKFGTILENVMMFDGTRTPDLDNAVLTENTRASYPLSHIDGASRTGVARHPKVVIMLTADAFGLLPAISILSHEQAVDHFLLGYTSKVAGTENGVVTPKTTFSYCFGAPFMPRNPIDYAFLFEKKIKEHNVRCYLVNTGWFGGKPNGANRMPIQITRELVKSALNGTIEKCKTRKDNFFGLSIPESCPNVPSDFLNPILSWENKDEYAREARGLRSLFNYHLKYVYDPRLA